MYNITPYTYTHSLLDINLWGESLLAQKPPTQTNLIIVLKLILQSY